MSEKFDEAGLSRILVVDDTTANLQLLTQLLKEQGYLVYPASDGQLALRFVQSILPDLILLDIKMPGMDGFEVCRRLKLDERTRSIPIIFISILEDESNKVKGFQAGGVDYITKPLHSAEVLARVRTHLRLVKLTEHLEQKVSERTNELMDANRHLKMQITKRKAAEESLRQFNMELDQRIGERTMELEAAYKELESFAYSVSHDLRAPLRHIDGFMGMLQQRAGSDLDEQSRHYMDTITGAAQKMGDLIDDLLSFSRMGRQVPSVQLLDLGSLVHEIMEKLEPDMVDREIEWHINDLPSVSGDASLLRMVLDNLISNALKFTRTRQKAQIEIGSIPDQASKTVIYVRDNGVGFDMTYVEKLFGVFQRLHRAEEFEGTGIGLATVQRIIRRHGGKTWAEGKVDQGATFYFSLPS